MSVNRTPASNKWNFSETDISPGESNCKKSAIEEKQGSDIDPIAKLCAKIESLTETLDSLKKSNDNLTKKIDGIVGSVGENSAAISEL